MNVAIEWQTLSLQLVVTFAHFLWQAVLVGAVLAVSLRLASQAESKTRYALACLAFLALPICVVLTFATVCLDGDPIVVSETRGAADARSIVVQLEPNVKTTDVTIQESVDLGVAGPVMASLPAVPVVELENSSEPVLAGDEIIRIWSPYLLSVYCLGVIALLLRTTMATWSGRRLRWSTQPIADSKYLGLIAEQAQRMGFLRVPLVATCNRVSVPVVVGVLKPTILLPPALLCGLDANQVAAILRHEMAHIRRYDPLVNLLQRFVESLLFFHPVTWWISRRISIERENCCDDLASVDCGSFQYAGALLQMAELCATARGMQITPQLSTIGADGGNASQLSCRIHRLLGEPIAPRLAVTRTAWSIALGFVFVCCLSVFSVAQSGDISPQPVANEGGDPSDAVPAKRPAAPQPDEAGIYWSGRDTDGWIAGMKIIERPSADSPVLVVRYLLRNARDTERSINLSVHGRGRSTVDISAGNRIRADAGGGSWLEDHTVAGNQVLRPDHWQTRFNFEGLEPGEYSVRFGSAFYVPVEDQVGTRSGIPFGLTLPINIPGPGNAAQFDASEVADRSYAALPIRWGEPVNGLRIGVVFADSPKTSDKSFRHGDLAQARLFVQNVSNQSVECQVMLPHPMDGWGLNVNDADGNSVKHHQVYFSMFSPLRLFSGELAPQEIQPISGKLPKFREGNEDEGFVPELKHAEFRIADTLPKEAEHSPPFTYGMSAGRYHARWFANLRRMDVPDANLSVETGRLAFEVGGEDAAGDVARSDTQLTVTAIDEAAKKPMSDVYLTLWRALSAGEPEPVNTVNGSSGFGYYNPVIWEDRESDARWVRVASAHPNDGRHGGGKEQFHFSSLGPGRYRVTAVPYRPKQGTPDPTPYGVSGVFRCDGRQPATIEIKLLAGDAAVTLRMVDAQSRQPIARIGIRLRNESGMPIVHGHGSGNYFERTDDKGEVRFGRLKPGNYSVEVLGKHARVNQFVEYLPIAEWVQMKVEPGVGTTEIAVAPRQLPEQEISERFPFSVFGRVTDPDGKPLANVEIRAATGRGTLRGGGTVKTDADGRYRLYFGPGIRTQVGENSPLGVGVQAAHFFASKTGWELDGEPSDHELLMSDRSPEQLSQQFEKDGPLWGRTDTTDVIFARQPRELNFAVQIVTQKDGQQVADKAETTKVGATAERPEARYPYCVIDIENLETRSLADAIADFNMQSMESPIGRFQPPVTEVETLEAIKTFTAQSHLPASIKSTLRQIESSKKLPPTAYFRRFTRFDDGQLMHRVWWVRLVITGDDPPVYSVPVRTKSFTSRSYTQMERQQHASGGLTLINRFSSYFEVPPNILLLAEFPQDAKDRLIADAKAAIAGDANALERVFQWEGVSKSTRQFVTTELQQLRQAKIGSIKIRPRNFKAKMVHWSAYQRYQPNLPIVGYLDIEYEPAAGDPGPTRTLSLEMGRSGDEFRLVNYIKDGEREFPPTLGKGLSTSGQTEPLADGTYLMSTLTTNPGTLLSAHLGNEEIWLREF